VFSDAWNWGRFLLGRLVKSVMAGSRLPSARPPSVRGVGPAETAEHRVPSRPAITCAT
jgi:hypothetical protein